MSRRLRTMLPVLALVAGAPSAADDAAPGPTAAERLGRAVEAYYDEYLESNPMLATSIGDHRFDDRLTIGIAPAERTRALALERRYLAAVESIPAAELSEKERLTREVFLAGRRDALAAEPFPDHLLPVDQFASMPIIFAVLGGGGSIQPFETVTDYEHWLERIEMWPVWVEQAIANMRQGVERGVVQPRILVERALPLLGAHVVDRATESVFWRPVTTMPNSIPAAERERLAGSYRQAIERTIVPGYRRLQSYLRDEYLEQARDSVGLSALPDGTAWYAYLVRHHTTTRLTPEQIHRTGVQEVRRLERAIAAAGRREWPATAVRYDGTLLDGYRELRGRVAARLPELFGRIPAADFEVRAVEAFRRGAAAGASYVPGAPDGSRPGVFYVNADERTRGTPSEALFLHEAIPGHHFQIALQRESRELPRFRRFGHSTAFVEGWALYVERLGEALGLYRDREQSVRALRSELFRARRLVVDTGLHAMGWSRQRAIDELGDVNEVDRYIAMPGQALAYTIGQLRILEMRARAERALGDRFDLRAFHDEVLREGAVPLDVLERRIDAWVAASRHAARDPG